MDSVHPFGLYVDISIIVPKMGSLPDLSDKYI